MSAVIGLHLLEAIWRLNFSDTSMKLKGERDCFVREKMGKLSRMRAFEVGLESGHVLDMQIWGRRQSMNKAAVGGAELTAHTNSVQQSHVIRTARWGVTA